MAKKATGKAKKSGKFVYLFGRKTDGNGTMKPLLGGKGANLAEMCRIGLPVPPGFTITTEVCTEFYDNGKKLPKALDADIRASIARMERVVDAKFGDPKNPLLVSVRSGARASMPGMDARAPERTETSSGFFGSPNFAPTTRSMRAMDARISPSSAFGNFLPLS